MRPRETNHLFGPEKFSQWWTRTLFHLAFKPFLIQQRRTSRLERAGEYFLFFWLFVIDLWSHVSVSILWYEQSPINPMFAWLDPEETYKPKWFHSKVRTKAILVIRWSRHWCSTWLLSGTWLMRLIRNSLTCGYRSGEFKLGSNQISSPCTLTQETY